MYGLVNIAVQDLVCSKFGEAVWLKIKEKAGVREPVFSRMAQYDDAITYNLVKSASEVLDIPPDKVLEVFGEFWVLFTGQHGYGHLFSMTGDSLKEFLFNLDNLHSRVGLNFKDLVPPSFQFEELGEDRLLMHYHSERTGLCPMVVGLLHGLSQHFKTPLEVEETACQRKGAPHCEFHLRLGQRHE
jgi:hypothetical protein